MSNCSNCYNGCTEIVSDRCIKYTGIDVPVLGIQTGDSLSFVEQALITFLVSTLDGTGIKIDLGTTVVCNLVQKYLPTCGDLTIVDISKALIQAACDLQVQVNAIVAELAVLNADYTIGCLTGVTASSDTHAIVQATITKLCSVNSSVTTILNQLPLYVTKSEFCTLLANCTSNTPTSPIKYYNRMIPYAVVEFYDPNLSGKFDGTGKGLDSGPWQNIYLCNGQNGTPDKRGRVGVGTTDGSMLGLALPSDTNPGSSSFNPTYTLGGSGSTSNQTSLSVLQIPAHTHIAISTVNDPKHAHGISGTLHNAAGAGSEGILNPGTSSYTTNSSFTGITVNTVNQLQGGSQAHSNVQVGLGCYYIQYRP